MFDADSVRMPDRRRLFLGAPARVGIAALARSEEGTVYGATNGALQVGICLVPRRGLEPPRPCERQHLKLVRLPIPPPGHRSYDFSW